MTISVLPPYVPFDLTGCCTIFPKLWLCSTASAITFRSATSCWWWLLLGAGWGDPPLAHIILVSQKYCAIYKWQFVDLLD